MDAGLGKIIIKKGIPPGNSQLRFLVAITHLESECY